LAALSTAALVMVRERAAMADAREERRARRDSSSGAAVRRARCAAPSVDMAVEGDFLIFF
jgi:hypothetical protein